MQSMTRSASDALDLLHDIQPGPALRNYLGGIDATLAPYGDADHHALHILSRAEVAS